MQRVPLLSSRPAAAGPMVAAGLGILLGLAGCGNPGLPLPPSLMLPVPVTDLRAARTGDTVTLQWTMPGRSTDRVLLRGETPVAICRAVGSGACRAAGTLQWKVGAPAQWTEQLPPELRSGPAQLLRYEVRLGNRRRQDAGPSNPAWTAAGAAPPALASTGAEATAKGIVVHWAALPVAGAPPAGAKLLVRLGRDRVLGPNESEKPAPGELARGVPQPMQGVLEAGEHAEGSTGAWTPSETVDADATLNRSYRYSVQLAERLLLDGHAIEIDGASAQTPVVEAKDLFAPATPADLSAVSNAEGAPNEATIDLSWSAGAEPDLAGYFVYRRVSGSSDPPVRVSGDHPLPSASWSDPHPARGGRYGYSVSAVDTSGNESARSAEVVEALP